MSVENNLPKGRLVAMFDGQINALPELELRQIKGVVREAEGVERIQEQDNENYVSWRVIFTGRTMEAMESDIKKVSGCVEVHPLGFEAA